jgi:hypothetical protein
MHSYIKQYQYPDLWWNCIMPDTFVDKTFNSIHNKIKPIITTKSYTLKYNKQVVKWEQIKDGETSTYVCNKYFVEIPDMEQTVVTYKVIKQRAIKQSVKKSTWQCPHKLHASQRKFLKLTGDKVL